MLKIEMYTNVRAERERLLSPGRVEKCLRINIMCLRDDILFLMPHVKLECCEYNVHIIEI